MKINTTAALLVHLDSFGINLMELQADDDRASARVLCELINNGLKQKNFETSEPINEAPFYSFKCKSGLFNYQISCYLCLPKEENSVWSVSCERTLGFTDRLLGKNEDKDLSVLLEAIHEIFITSSEIKNIKWFEDDIPVDVFECNKGFERPIY